MMVEPVSVIVGITTVINLVSIGVSWFKKWIGIDSSAATTLLIPVATYPPVIYASPIIEDTASILEQKIITYSITYYSFFRLITENEYENFKRKKEPLQDFESNERTSSSNPGSTISLILIIVLILAVIAFVFYRKRAKLQANRFSFRQTERKFESLTSPPTSQIEPNPTFV
ncbi:unnamed protein product [Rotaria sp. Silwood1]|nr:unnamed protein product [Rotaria sp. Silwood1]CAF3382333.1 unnamed protein product [Rotaria sp. Silwood1]CAF3389033.1 unnamed protein product [Rotaria sp. Silwood1]CAF4744998.1 unnamed protein product [Rotaria sp. Silwood1]